MDNLPDKILDLLLLRLLQVGPKSRGTLDYVDMGVSSLLKRDAARAIDFLEKFLLAHPNDFSINIFDDTVRDLHSNKNNVLNRLSTRWFLNGDKALCTGISDIISAVHGSPLQLIVDSSELASVEHGHLIFSARKSIGYLFAKPVSAASFVLSLVEHANVEAVAQDLSELLFETLLINYPGQTKEYFDTKLNDNKSEAVRTAIELAVKSFDEYLNDLKSVGKISELNPSQAQRETHSRRFSRMMTKSMKEAEKSSVLLSIVSKSVLLYGRKSINYVFAQGEEPNRMEIPLQSFSTTMEFPRIDRLDNFGLNHMLRCFRAERLKV